MRNNFILVQSDFGVKNAAQLMVVTNAVVLPMTTSVTPHQQGRARCSMERQLTSHPRQQFQLGSLPPRCRRLAGCTAATRAAPGGTVEAPVPWHGYYWMPNWKTKQNHLFGIQLPFAPLEKYKLKPSFELV